MKNRFIAGIILSIVSLAAVSAYNMPYTISVVSKGTFISPDAGIQCTVFADGNNLYCAENININEHTPATLQIQNDKILSVTIKAG